MQVFSDVIFEKRKIWLYMTHMIQVFWEFDWGHPNVLIFIILIIKLLGIDGWVSGLVVPRFSVALSTDTATLYHPRRPEFSTTLLWKPH
jgi:hypothetical protein